MHYLDEGDPDAREVQCLPCEVAEKLLVFVSLSFIQGDPVPARRALLVAILPPHHPPAHLPRLPRRRPRLCRLRQVKLYREAT